MSKYDALNEMHAMLQPLPVAARNERHAKLAGATSALVPTYARGINFKVLKAANDVAPKTKLADNPTAEPQMVPRGGSLFDGLAAPVEAITVGAANRHPQQFARGSNARARLAAPAPGGRRKQPQNIQQAYNRWNCLPQCNFG